MLMSANSALGYLSKCLVRIHQPRFNTDIDYGIALEYTRLVTRP